MKLDAINISLGVSSDILPPTTLSCIKSIMYFTKDGLLRQASIRNRQNSAKSSNVCTNYLSTACVAFTVMGGIINHQDNAMHWQKDQHLPVRGSWTFNNEVLAGR